MPSRLPALLALALAILATLAVASPARAVVFDDPGRSGAAVDISRTSVAEGDVLTLRGSGFANDAAAASRPLVAIKIDDLDPAGPTWAHGGPSRSDGPPAYEADARFWFTVAPDGTWEGTLTVGELPEGAHSFRILSGAFSTVGLDGNRTVPITYTAPFRVVPDLELGFVNPSTGSYSAGTTFNVGIGGIAARTAAPGLLDPSAPVTVTVDGQVATPAGGLTTDAEGRLPVDATSGVPTATQRFALPTGVAPGQRTVTFTTGSRSISSTATVVPRAAISARTTRVRPGGRVVVDIANFLNVDGTPQTVALANAVSPPDTTILNAPCAPADATGAARLTGVVPARSDGTYVIRVLAGTKCQPPTAKELPARPPADPGVTVVADAPTATAPALVAKDAPTIIRGEGLPAGTTARLLVDGAAQASTSTVRADGTASVRLDLAAGTPEGERLLELEAGEGAARAVAATTFRAVPAATQRVTSATLLPGGTVTFDVTGWRREDGAGGQRIAVKLDDDDTVRGCVTTDAEGAASGSLALPADLPTGAHEVRLLAGASCVQAGGIVEAPARTVVLPFTVAPAPAPDGPAPDPGITPDPTPDPDATTPTDTTTPPQPTVPVPLPVPVPAPPVAPATTTPAPTAAATRRPTRVTRVRLRGRSLLLTLARGELTGRSTVRVRTAARVRLTPRARAAVVSLAEGTTSRRTGTLRLTLTARGRTVLRRAGRVRVVVEVRTAGVRASTALVLRR